MSELKDILMLELVGIVSFQRYHLQALEQKPHCSTSLLLWVPQVFNCLPDVCRNIEVALTETFKNLLDDPLTTIQDQPNIQGYFQGRSVITNLIINQLSISKTVKLQQDGN